MGAAGFIRRSTFDPGLAEILAIEGLFIIDRDPPQQVIGAGSGTALLVAEFENGPYNTPTEVITATDVLNTFGGLGYTYDGVVANNPSARGRKADGAVNFEFWNGNGAVALAGKKFKRLVLCRVDTSVGEVLFSRTAFLLGSSAFNYDLEPAEHIDIKINGAAALVATFSATAALINSAAGTYPSTFVGGESITYTIDGTQYQTFFLAADQTQTQVIARLNATVGFTAFTNTGGGVTRITGRQRGTGGNVQINAVSGALVTTATGFSAGAAVAGTGNVANIDQVTFAEVKTIVEAAVAGSLVDRDANGKLRISNVGTPLTGTIEVDVASTANGLGFTEAVVATAVTGVDGVIPAGTRVQNTGGTNVFVTTQDVTVTAANAGPYTARVRHALDDGTGLTALTGTIVAMPAGISLGSFSVVNLLPISPALTEAQIDAKYTTALDKTKNTSTVCKQVDLIWSARQSNAIRTALRQNAIDASANGCFGRRAVIRPPLGTTRAAARSTVSQPGVGTYRHQRVGYAFPGVQVRMADIALRGTAGGAGFTADGIIDTGFDGFVVSVTAQLNPEENPGQTTDFLLGALGIEKNNPDVQNLEMADYIAFKAAGIMAPRFDGGDCVIQSGVTSVDPAVNFALKNWARRGIADYIQNSLGDTLLQLTKKLMTISRRADALSLVDSFLNSLKTVERIAAYSVNGKDGNTAATIAAGVYRITAKVQSLPSMDSIVLDITTGELVQVDVQLAA